MEPSSLVLQVVYLPAEPPGKSTNTGVGRLSFLQQIFPGIEPGSPAWQVDFFFLPTELSGKLLLPTELAGKPTPTFLGFPCGSAGKASFCNAGDLGDTWVGKIPWRRERLPIPVFWPGEFHGLYSPWGCKESDTTEQLSLSSSPRRRGLMGMLTA